MRRSGAKRLLSLVLSCAVFVVTVLENPVPVMADEEENVTNRTGLKPFVEAEAYDATEEDILFDVDDIYEEFEEKVSLNPDLTVEDFFESYVEELSEADKSQDTEDESELNCDAEPAEDFYEELTEGFYEESTEEFYEESTEEFYEELVEELDEELVEGFYEDVTEEFCEEPADEFYEDLLEDICEETSGDLLGEAYEEVVEEPCEEAEEVLCEDSGEVLCEDSGEEFCEETVEELCGEPAEEYYDEPEEELCGESVEELNTEDEGEEFELYSAVYDNEWDKFSSNYTYNQLSNKQKVFWNSLNSIALSILNNSSNCEQYGKFVSYSGSDAKKLVRMFKLENPQYYFIDNSVWTWGSSYSFGIYSEFRKGSKRKSATADYKQHVDNFITQVNNKASDNSDFAKAKAVQQVIDSNVVYYSNSFDQTSYSTFVIGKTVCAGYAAATCMLCNYFDVDCLVVTSSEHAWNQVSIDDNWYNMDATWDDGSGGTQYYNYFLKSDADYSTDSDHIIEALWKPNGKKLTADCTVSSGSYGTTAVKPGTPTTAVQDPVINVYSKKGAIWVNLSCPTTGAKIYYTLDGKRASDSYSRSSIYAGDFKVNNLEQLSKLNVVAIKDRYRNSENIDYEPCSYFTFSGNKIIGLTQKGKGTSELTIPTGVTAIGNGALEGDNTVTFIKIPSTVTSIGSRAFANCSKIRKIDFADSTKVKSIANGAFSEIPDSCRIYVRGGSSLEKYLKNNGLSSNICAKYTITYKLNGGQNDVQNPGTYVSNNNEDVYFYDPERHGYDFAGWYTNSKFKAGTEITSTEGKSSNLVLYAKWTPITYSITYDSDGATKEAVNPATYNITKAVKFKNPSKTGFGFLGWFKDGSKITQIKKGSTGDIDLYANWQEYSYTVSYNANGGKGYFAPETHKYTDEFNLPDNVSETMTRKGYTFLGWSTAKSSAKKGAKNFFIDDGSYRYVSGLSAKKNGKITLYAIWQAIPYDITYYLNDAPDYSAVNSSKNSYTYTIAAAKKLYAPTRTGYTFGGWFTKDPEAIDFNPKVDKKVSTIKKGSTEAKEFYAKWTVNKYTVKFSANGGKGRMNDMKGLAYNETYTLPANTFTKGSYTFAGWNTSPKGTGTFISDGSDISGLVSKNGGKITLYAIWE